MFNGFSAFGGESGGTIMGASECSTGRSQRWRTPSWKFGVIVVDRGDI